MDTFCLGNPANPTPASTGVTTPASYSLPTATPTPDRPVSSSQMIRSAQLRHGQSETKL